MQFESVFLRFALIRRGYELHAMGVISQIAISFRLGSTASASRDQRMTALRIGPDRNQETEHVKWVAE